MSETIEQKLESAQHENETLKKENSELKDQLKLAGDVNAEIQRQLEETRQAAKAGKKKYIGPTIKHNGKQYTVTRERFNVPGIGEVEAKNLQSNVKAIEWLIKRNSPVLKLK